MGEITIHLCKGITGEVVSAKLPDDLPIPEILGLVDRQFNFGIGGREDRFVMYNISQKFEYASADTLSSRATEGGDLNLIVDSAHCVFEPAKKT